MNINVVLNGVFFGINVYFFATTGSYISLLLAVLCGYSFVRSLENL